MNDVLQYIDTLAETSRRDNALDEFKNSVTYKKRCLDVAKNNAREDCLAHILGNVYKDAVPLSNEYKTVYGDELNNDFKDFILDKSPNGVEYYIHEQQKKNPACIPATDKLLKAVESFVEKHYLEQTLQPANINTDELVFDVDDSENIQALDIISADLDYPTISDLIADNVSDTVKSEIARAKMEQEKNALLEDKLANNLSILTPEAATESYNILSGNKSHEVYVPTLMEAVMIGNTAKYTNLLNAGEVLEEKYTYKALEPLGKVYTEEVEQKPASLDEIVFIEAVQELTKHYLLNTFRLEDYDKQKLTALALEYGTQGNN